MKRTSAALLGASLMLTTVVPVIHAEEQTPPPLVPSISEWAIETLNEGEKYGIYSTEWYFDGFLQEISVDKVNELLALTEKKLLL